MTQPTEQTEGEILISGVDSGPSNEERDRPTRTERLAQLIPLEDTEPEDEDG